MKIIDVNRTVGIPLRSKRCVESDGLIRWMYKFRISQALTYHSVFHPDPLA